MGDRYLIVKASGGGGLGDCIKSVLVAAEYAQQSNRVLVVDWAGGVYSERGSNPFFDYFTILGVRHQINMPESNDVFPPSWENRKLHSLHEVYTEDGWTTWDREKTIKLYSIDLANLDYQNEVLIMWDFDQLSKLGFTANTDSYRKLRTQYLGLSDSMCTLLDDELKHQGRLDLGIHIRASKEFYANKTKAPSISYFSTLDKLEKSKPLLENWFLATDNKAVLSDFINQYPRTKYIDKWFGKSGEPLHLNQARPSAAQNLREALLDVLMLGRCSHLLVTLGSSFSEMAQIFACDRQTIYSPQESFLGRIKKTFIPR